MPARFVIHRGDNATFARRISDPGRCAKILVIFITGIININFHYDVDRFTLHCNIADKGNLMTAATRRFFTSATIAFHRFTTELYAAHGGWAPTVRG
jgi:hypothetical protein